MSDITKFTKEFVDGLLDARVKPAEMNLAMLIISMTVWKNGRDWTEPIAVDVIARRLGGIGMSTVSTAIKKLKDRGFLETSRDGKGSNTYQVRIPEKGSYSTFKSFKTVKRKRTIRM